MNQQRDEFTVEEAAKWVGRSVRTIHRWAASGILTPISYPAEPVPGVQTRTFFALAELERLRKKARHKPNADAQGQG